MSKSTRKRLAVIAWLSYVSLEAGLLYGLYVAAQRSWLEMWIVYPSAVIMAITTVLVSAPQSRRYLIQPALALLIIMVASSLQEVTAEVDLAVLAAHAAAIVWICTSFMVYISNIPPSHTARRMLSKVAGIGLLSLEVPFMLYTIRQSASILDRNTGAILAILVIVTVVFGLIFAYILFLNVRSHKFVSQGS